MTVEDYRAEYDRYRGIAERVLATRPDDAELDRLPAPGMNTIGIIVHHVGNNLKSRFTDFLTADGEKPWRGRDAEFAEGRRDPATLLALWREGWAVLGRALDGLEGLDLDATTVVIRGETLSVNRALCRSLAHTAHHVGELVALARTFRGEAWEILSIPRNGSAAYHQRHGMAGGA